MRAKPVYGEVMVLLIIALVLFLIAGVFALIPATANVWPAMVAFGLAAWVASNFIH